MRPHHCTITPAVIHQHARDALRRALPWKTVGAAVSVPDLLDLLLLMAASTASLFAVVQRFFSFSHESARRAVHANLPNVEQVAHGLLQALYDSAQFSRCDRRRRWLAAIDTHFIPYYGRRTAAVVGGPKKQGAHWFFGYATAVLLHRGRRYTIALSALAPKTKPHQIVATLLDQIAGKGLKIGGVVLDSGFDSGETFLLSQQRRLAYTVPLKRKGSTRNARNRLFEGRHRQVRWTRWYVKDTPREVTTRTVLWKGRHKTLLLAFQGWKANRAHHVHQEAGRQGRLYQKRFGIETSYRQKNQAQAATTSRDPAYRLLLEGLGYLLRQVWVVLTQQLSRAGAAGYKGWVAALPLRRLLQWLFQALIHYHPEQLSISAP